MLLKFEIALTFGDVMFSSVGGFPVLFLGAAVLWLVPSGRAFYPQFLEGGVYMLGSYFFFSLYPWMLLMWNFSYWSCKKPFDVETQLLSM